MSLPNRAKCRKCGDVIESKTQHDYQACRCGAIAVDGGPVYTRCVGALEDFLPVDPEPELTSVSQAREMGFDEDTIADLLAEGLLKADEVWRPRTLDDVNFLVMRERQYDAEEARITEQYERRLHKIRKRREWIRRYDDDCLEVVKRDLPRRKDGTYREKYLDLPDGRVLLREEGGGLTVDPEAYLKWAKSYPDSVYSIPSIEALRISRVEVETAGAALNQLLTWPDEKWKVEILKTPISEYLKAHPDATLPGVTVEPRREVFRIERPKARKGEGDGRQAE